MTTTSKAHPDAASAPAESTVYTIHAPERLADLGARARGFRVEDVELRHPTRGLPLRVPIGVRLGDKPEPVDLRPLIEEWRHAPERKTGTATVDTVESFIALVDRHATEESAIFATTDWRRPSFTAVIDYHGPGDDQAAFCQHRIVYRFPISDAWTLWTEHDGKPMDQGEFAAFLEDRIADLSSPTDAEVAEFQRLFATSVATPAQLVKLSRGLQVNVEATVLNATVLQSGEGQLVFEEKHKGADGQPISVPGLFILQIEPFFMGELVRIPVRLRYRVKGGAIAWHYQMYRPDQHVTERVRADLDVVRERTGLPCFEGQPEDA